MEDDLEVSPDILSYFRRMSELLFDSAENMFCVSAWNDNGKEHQILPDPTLVHRTDFFGGLGWMLRRDVSLLDKFMHTISGLSLFILISF